MAKLRMRRKPESFDAIEFTGENVAEINEMTAPLEFVRRVSDGGMVFLDCPQDGNNFAHVGDFVTHGAKGTSVWSRESLYRAFEPIKMSLRQSQ